MILTITNQTLVALGKGNVRRGGTVTLVVGDDFNAVVGPETDTRVGGTQVYTLVFAHFAHLINQSPLCNPLSLWHLPVAKFAPTLQSTLWLQLHPNGAQLIRKRQRTDTDSTFKDVLGRHF